MKQKFNSPTLGKVDFKTVVATILEFIQKEKLTHYRIIIGTDSEGNGKSVEFVRVIIVYEVGRGGRYFWQKIKRENINSLRHKIYEETNLSLELAVLLLEQIRAKIKKDFAQNLEIHVDVGETGPTKDLIKEIRAMVVGNGFHLKTKPESFGASNVADKHL